MTRFDRRWLALARARNQRAQLELAHDNPYPAEIEALIRAEIAKSKAEAELYK